MHAKRHVAIGLAGAVASLVVVLLAGAEPPDAPDATQRDESNAAQEACAKVGGRLAGGRENMCYIMHGLDADRDAPKDGYRLLIVLPGGDGSAEFRSFVGSIAARAMPPGYIVAQAVAPVWDEDENRIVWPTRGLPSPNMKFPAEEFVAAIIDDVSKDHTIDRQHIYALGWSSGGPPLYATMLQEKTKLRGALIAMSVFHPAQYPPAENAAGRSFYLLHSPQDFIPMRFPEQARDALTAAGANVQLQTYEGGHGWRGDTFGMIREGIERLESWSGLAGENEGIGTSPEG